MKKKYFVFFILLLEVFSLTSQENPKTQKNNSSVYNASFFDMTIQFYPPSLPGFSNGIKNTVFGFQNNFINPKYFLSGDIESRFLVYKYKKLSLATSFMSGFAVDDLSNFAIKISTGFGAYYNFKPESTLTGAYLFVYPMFGLPVYTKSSYIVTNWRIAMDLGFSAEIVRYVSVSLFLRNTFAWYTNDFLILPDVGLAIGVRIRD